MTGRVPTPPRCAGHTPHPVIEGGWLTCDVCGRPLLDLTPPASTPSPDKGD